MANVLLVVEDALFTRLTSLAAYTAQLATDGWTVEVFRHDSRLYNSSGIAFGVNISSSAANALATATVWPRVNSGLKHIVFLGELPCFVSGLNACPDGHGSTFVVGDGWRDAVNTAGAYKAMQIYGAPGSGYSDIQNGQLSLNVQRQNGVGDGRFDQDNFPGLKIKAAVGWVGGFGDLAVDSFGLDRRAAIINSYLNRNVLYRTGGWNLSGAVYEFPVPSSDPHASANWYNQAVEIFGSPLVQANAHVVLGSGALVTNRAVGYKLAYTGSSWIPDLTDNLLNYFAAFEFLRLSYNFECPSGNFLGQAIKNSVDYGPLICIPYYDSGQGLDIRLLAAGNTMGEVIIAASAAKSITPVPVGCMGDITLRLIGPGSGSSSITMFADSVVTDTIFPGS